MCRETIHLYGETIHIYRVTVYLYRESDHLYRETVHLCRETVFLCVTFQVQMDMSEEPSSFHFILYYLFRKRQLRMFRDHVPE
jgi:hypothetical protein